MPKDKKIKIITGVILSLGLLFLGIRAMRQIPEIELPTQIEETIPEDIVIDIAEARCIVNGNVTASQVKNGEGKAQGLTTLSRLMNSKNSQWLLQNKKEDSTVKEFSLYDLIEDVYVTIEKHDLSTTKPVNKFSISEGIYS